MSPLRYFAKLLNTLINMSEDAEEGKGQRNYGNKHREYFLICNFRPWKVQFASLPHQFVKDSRAFHFSDTQPQCKCSPQILRSGRSRPICSPLHPSPQEWRTQYTCDYKDHLRLRVQSFLFIKVPHKQLESVQSRTEITLTGRGCRKRATQKASWGGWKEE